MTTTKMFKVVTYTKGAQPLGGVALAAHVGGTITGPFKTREAAERALIAALNAGHWASGSVVTSDETCDETKETVRP